MAMDEDRPSTLPSWATDGDAEIVEPSAGKKAIGWLTSEQPPAGWFNWWKNSVYTWLSYIDSVIALLKVMTYDDLYLSLALGRGYNNVSDTAFDWCYGSGGFPFWKSLANSGQMSFPLILPRGQTINISVEVRADPGAVRTGTDRLAVSIKYFKLPQSAPEYGVYTVADWVYDDGTADEQTITVSATSHTVDSEGIYYIHVKAGNTGAANADYIRRVKRTLT